MERDDGKHQVFLTLSSIPTFNGADAIAIGADTALEVRANDETDLVVFLIDRTTRFSRAGTMSAC